MTRGKLAKARLRLYFNRTNRSSNKYWLDTPALEFLSELLGIHCYDKHILLQGNKLTKSMVIKHKGVLYRYSFELGWSGKSNGKSLSYWALAD